MPVLIKLIKLKNDELIIEPIRNENLSNHPHEYDLSIELAELKKQLAQIELYEGKEYVRITGPYLNTSPDYRLQFTGKSIVLRAIYTIQKELIEFSPYNGTVPVSINELEQFRLIFATKISDRECTVYDKAFVDKAFQILFDELKQAIVKVHSDFKQPSKIINQLQVDINCISAMDNTNSFKNPKFLLLMASLSQARILEKAELTIQEKKILSIMKGNSLLLPKYDALLMQFAPFTPGDYSEELDLKLMKTSGSKLRDLYNNYVKSMQTNRTFTNEKH